MPRLTARSMLSFGTEASFAFWMAVASVALPSRSPPPSRAATSMARVSLANSLPRLASWRPLLVLDVRPLGMSRHQPSSAIAAAVRGPGCRR